MKEFTSRMPKSQKELAAIATTLLNWQERNQKRTLLRSLPSGWRNNFYEPQQATYFFDEEELKVQYIFQQKNQFEFQIGENKWSVFLPPLSLKGEPKVENSSSNFKSNHSPFRGSGGKKSQISFRVNGIQHQASIAQNGNQYFIHLPETGNISLKKKERFPTKAAAKIEGGYEAPMPSQIIKILVEAGQKVKTEDALMIISSMKMENTILAEKDGTVTEIYATEGQNVEAGFLLLKVE